MKKRLYTKILIRKGLNTLSVLLCSLFSLFSYAKIYTTGDNILYVSQDATITPTKLFVESIYTFVSKEDTNANIVATLTSILPVEEKKRLAVKKNLPKHLVKKKIEVEKAISDNHLVFFKNNTKQIFTKDPRNVCGAATLTYNIKYIAVLSKISKVFVLEILDNIKNTISYVNKKTTDNLLSAHRVRPPPFFT